MSPSELVGSTMLLAVIVTMYTVFFVSVLRDGGWRQAVVWVGGTMAASMFVLVGAFLASGGAA